MSVAEKLKSVDAKKLNPAQIKKIVAALAQEAKRGARVTANAKAVLNDIATAKAALKSSENDFSSIED